MRRALSAAIFLCAASALSGAAPWAELTSPQGDPVRVAQVEVICRLASHVDASTLRIEVDGTDLTAFLSATDRTVTIQVPGPLADGSHELVLSGQDLQRIPLPPLRRSFAIRATQRREISISGTLSDQFNSTLRHDDLPEQADTQAGLAQGQVSVKTGALEQELSVTTIYNTPSPPPPSQEKFDLSSASYGLKYEKESLKFAASIGQVTCDLSPLALSGYSTRGGTFHFDIKGIGLDAFSLDTRRPFGWKGNIGPSSETDHHINGFRFQARMLEGAEFYGVFLKGSEQEASSYNISTQAAPASGEVAGIGGKFGLGSWSGLAEFTESRPANGGDARPKAYRLQTGTQRQTFNIQMSYQRIEEGYSSPGIPYLPSDREEAMANVQFYKGTTQAGLSLGYQRDNLSGHGLLPELRQWRGGLTINQGLGSALNLSFSYNGTQQVGDSTGTFPSRDLATHTASTGLSLRAGGHFLQYGVNFSRLDDRGPFNNDNQMYGHQMMYMVGVGGRLDISSSLQYNLVRPTLQDDYAEQVTANLDVRTRFWRNTLNVDFGGSWNRSKPNDQSDASEMSASHLRFGYKPFERWKGLSQSSLSLDFRQTRAAFAGQTQTTLQVLLTAALNLSGRYAHAK